MKKLATVLSLMAGMALTAQAHLVKIDEYFLDSVLGNPAAEIDWTEDTLGESGLIELDKSDTEVPSGTSVSWDYSGESPAVFLWYVLIKDGSVDTAAGKKHLYALYEVTPDQQIVGDGTVGFDSGKDVSHQLFMGKTTRRPPQQTPDGGATAALLGIGLIGLAAFRQKR